MTLIRIAPPLFVFLWASGFVTARIAGEHGDPLLFLGLRFSVAALILAAVVVLTRTPWPDARGAGRAAITGLLIYALYMAGVWEAVALGMPPATAALITGLQPLVTAAASAPLLGERVPPRRWFGLALGFVGAVLLLTERGLPAVGGTAAVALSVLALAAMTAGTLWQKRTGATGDLRAATAIQNAAAAAFCLALAPLAGDLRLDPVPAWFAAFAWAVLAQSLLAMALFFMLLRRGAAAQVSALFYLTPAVAALQDWALSGPVPGVQGIIGMAVATVAVAIAMR